MQTRKKTTLKSWIAEFLSCQKQPNLQKNKKIWFSFIVLGIYKALVKKAIAVAKKIESKMQFYKK